MSCLREHRGQPGPVNTYWVGFLWTEAALIGKEDESHIQPFPHSTFPLGGEDLILVMALDEYVQWRMALLPKGPQKGILTPRSPNPKPNHLKLPTHSRENCVSGEQEGLAQSHSQM